MVFSEQHQHWNISWLQYVCVVCFYYQGCETPHRQRGTGGLDKEWDIHLYISRAAAYSHFQAPPATGQGCSVRILRAGRRVELVLNSIFTDPVHTMQPCRHSSEQILLQRQCVTSERVQLGGNMKWHHSDTSWLFLSELHRWSTLIQISKSLFHVKYLFFWCVFLFI